MRKFEHLEQRLQLHGESTIEYQLDQQWDLQSNVGGEYLNWGGLNEKWMYAAATGGWRFIEPDGDLRAWMNDSNVADDPLVATLSTAVYADNSLLYDAYHEHEGEPPDEDHTHLTPDEEAEHQAVMNLVPLSSVTHTAVQSGSWSLGSTWVGGQVPTETSKVLIPEDVTVTITGDHAEALWVRVDGELAYSTTTDTALEVDTIIVTNDGTYTQEVPSPYTSTVTFRDSGEIDTEVYDPKAFSRGLISHGAIHINGKDKTPFVEVSSLAANATTAVVGSVTGWQVGDTVLIVGMAYGQDEVRQISSLSGGVVTFSSALTYAHQQLTSTDETSFVQNPIVANLTRNVVFTSESMIDSRRGHVMLMHNLDIEVRDAAFEHLGRTSKEQPVTDPDGEGNGLENPRGRYPLHFHRTHGSFHEDEPAIANGNVIRDTSGWGLVNHSSFVVAENNVSYDVHGAHYVGELGDEIGAFRNNLAVGSTGSPGVIQETRGNFDFAFQGFGYWVQGSGGISLEGNISAGQKSADYAVVNEPAASGTRFKVANLSDPSIWTGPNYWGEGNMSPGDVPLLFDGNTGWGQGEGVSVRFWGVHNPGYHQTKSVVRDSVIWGGVTWGYSVNLEAT